MRRRLPRKLVEKTYIKFNREFSNCPKQQKTRPIDKYEYDIDMKSPATSRYIGQTGGHQARRPKVYLGLDRDPVLVGIVRPPHSARRLCQRIPQIIAPPPHLQRSPGRPVFQYLVSCQPNLCQEPRQPVFSVFRSNCGIRSFRFLHSTSTNQKDCIARNTFQCSPHVLFVVS